MLLLLITALKRIIYACFNSLLRLSTKRKQPVWRWQNMAGLWWWTGPEA
jgi:hypothetical protein